jgi:hypothetical protein
MLHKFAAFTFLIWVLTLTACSKYYVVYSDMDVKFSSNSNASVAEDERNTDFIPSGSYILSRVAAEKLKSKSFVRFVNRTGYIRGQYRFRTEGRSTKRQYYSTYGSYFHYYKNQGSVLKRNYFYPSNDSVLTRGSINIRTSPALRTNGPVQVRGYYRKDGTYVRPHTRSAPRRK